MSEFLRCLKTVSHLVPWSSTPRHNVLSVISWNVCSVIFAPLRFLQIFFQWLRILNQNLACLLYVHVCIKLQNFIQWSLTLTNWCLFLCMTVQWIFAFYLKNLKNRDISRTIGPLATEFGTMMKSGLLSALAIKKFNFKNVTRWMTDVLEKLVLHHHEIWQFFN